MKLIKIEIDPDKGLRYLNKGTEQEKKFCHVILHYKGWFGKTKIVKATPVKYFQKKYDINWGWFPERILCVNELGEELDCEICAKIFNFITSNNLNQYPQKNQLED